MILLLDPMPGTIQQMAAAHLRARAVLHAFDRARGLVDPPILRPGNK